MRVREAKMAASREANRSEYIRLLRLEQGMKLFLLDEAYDTDVLMLDEDFRNSRQVIDFLYEIFVTAGKHCRRQARKKGIDLDRHIQVLGSIIESRHTKGKPLKWHKSEDIVKQRAARRVEGITDKYYKE